MAEADSLFTHSQFDEAFKLFESNAESFYGNGDQENYIYCHLRMAACEIGKGEIDAGVFRAEQSLEHIREYLEDTTSIIAQAHMVVGSGYLHVGRNDLALENLLLAEPYLEEKTLNKAECLEEIGVAYWNNGNRDLALQFHERALDIRRKIDQIPASLIGDSNNNIGLVYLNEEPLQSIIYFNRAVDLYQDNPEQNRRKIALCYVNIAYANAELANYMEALEYLDRMDSIWADIYDGPHGNKAFVLNNRGRIYKMKGDFNQALVYQQEALKMYLNIHGEKHPDVANTFLLIGQIYQQKGDYERAAINYQRSVYSNLYDQSFADLYSNPEIKNFYNADILLTSLQSKAKAMEALHFEKSLKKRDIDGALTSYLLCDELISIIRQTRINEADKLRLAGIAAEVYENGIYIAQYLSEHSFKKKEYLKIAFEFAERSKAALLLQAINDTNAKHFAGIPDSELALEDSLKVEIDLLDQMLMQDISDEERERIKGQVFEYQRALRDFVSGLEEKYPSYYQLKYDTKLASVWDVQASLTDEEWLLSYFVGEKKIFVFSITSDKYQLFDVDKPEKFNSQVIGMRNTIKYRMEEENRSISKQLYQLLIPKMEKGKSSLTILPDGLLSTVTFESLIDEEGSYLIERIAINYDYSATLYLQKPLEQLHGDMSALLVAPVEFDANSGMSDLPSTEKEVNEIRYLLSGNGLTVDVSLHEQASESNVVHKLEEGYRYLHLATHGMVDEDHPGQSSIYLNADQSGDGRLYCSEIYSTKINSNLVSLSACETGLGKISQGEGVIGLSRALKYSGAQNLLVSLWQVNDQSTSELMISFYKNHLYHSDKEGYRDDLRKAKLEMIRSEKYSDPYYWAPFILIGR
ncbi:CHAT domain-containing protein [Reichenbachiella ulvae]|uniref:CHAT domain-containing protein n=1 Tax=Reichenbachiella ulvae TaxID=2980104 RepID=A0ABT3CS11_9BACT|nr:CHAT domain-containing protein [Reichenbachiella ulvae]MCV9386265.1 CHAT domain-containing protein [Reichenbachiella ulvae]